MRKCAAIMRSTVSVLAPALKVHERAPLTPPFEQLFGPHFESNKKTRVNSGADELRDYCEQTPHTPQWITLWRGGHTTRTASPVSQAFQELPAYTSSPSERMFSLAGTVT